MYNDIKKLQNGSDIRGVAMEGVKGESVNLGHDEAASIGAAFTYWLAYKRTKSFQALNICIGNDPRLSADPLVKALVTGINYMGAKATYAGLASTPAMFMSTVMPFYEFDGAIMVTASHLPFNRNGFKFFTEEGGLNKEDIAEILRIAERASIVTDFYEYENVELMPIYAAHLRSIISMGMGGKPDGMKVIVDAGNGAGGFFAEQVLAPLGFDVSGSLYLEPDGHFPNHAPNPEDPKALKALCTAVVSEHADLGIIFDTDVDRSAVVSPTGRPIARNEIVALAAAIGAKSHPGGTVVTDSITSKELTRFLEDSLDLKHLRLKRGYRNVINKAIELDAQGEDAFLAIETSGHAAFKDNYYLDDGAYLAALAVVEAARCKKEGKTIDSLIDGLSAPAESVEFRIPISADDFSAVADAALSSISDLADTHPALTLVTPNHEGVRVDFDFDGDTGWFLMRKSLHDPLLPLNVESSKEGTSALAVALIKEALAEVDGVDTSVL